MNFLKGPEYDSVRLVLFFTLIVFTGYFVYGLAGNSVLSQTGNILEATRDTTALGSGVTTETVVELNKEVERLNNVRTSDAWYVFEGRKKRAEKSLVETLEVRSEVISSLAIDGKTADQSEIALSEDVVALLPPEVNFETKMDVIVEGNITTQHYDDFNNPENSYFLYTLNAKDGQSHPLLLSEEIGIYNGSASVIGYMEDNVLVGRIGSLGTYQNGTIGEYINISNPQPVVFDPTHETVVFLVRYNDSGPAYFESSDMNEMLFGTVKDYFLTQSYNKVELVGDVFGWITLDRNSTDEQLCATSIEDLTPYIELNSIVLSEYDLVFIYNDCNYEVKNGFFNGETAQVRFFNDNYQYDFNEYLPTKFDKIAVHEIGHSLGFPHANGLDCGNRPYPIPGHFCTEIEYGNHFDPMGRGYIKDHFSGAFKLLANWLKEENLLSIEESGVYTLLPLDSLSIAESGKYYAEIRNTFGDLIYSVEYRSDSGGLLIAKEGTKMIDVVPTNSDWDYDVEESMVTEDNIFLDEYSGITIGPIISNDFKKAISFNVSIEDTNCSPVVPEIVFDSENDTSMSVKALNQGYQYEFKYVISNNNSLFCPKHLFELDIDDSDLPWIRSNLGYGTFLLDSGVSEERSFTIYKRDGEEIIPGVYTIPVQIKDGSDFYEDYYGEIINTQYFDIEIKGRELF